MFGPSNEEALQKGLRSCARDFNIIKLTLFKEYFGNGVIDPDSFEGAIYCQAIVYLFLGDLDENIGKFKDQIREKLEKSKEEIKKRASEMLDKDKNLANIMTYLLIYYGSLKSYQYGQDEFTKTDQCARIQEIIKFCGTDQSAALNKSKFLVSYKKFLKSHGVRFWHRTWLIFFRGLEF